MKSHQCNLKEARSVPMKGLRSSGLVVDPAWGPDTAFKTQQYSSVADRYPATDGPESLGVFGPVHSNFQTESPFWHRNEILSLSNQDTGQILQAHR